MNGLGLILLITFLESFSTIFVQRGMYFFTHELLGFVESQNLWLALAMGLAYAAGALGCHRVCAFVRERRLLVVCLVLAMFCTATMAVWPAAALLVAVGAVANGLCGMKWAIIESYVGAGRSPAAAVRAVGAFNLAWASAVPVCVISVGPLLRHWPSGLFWLPTLLTVGNLALVRLLSPQPAHMPPDAPERPAGGQMARYRALLVSTRWLLLVVFACLWILAALMPYIFAAMGFQLWAPALASVMDGVRFGAFVLLLAWTGWHGRRGLILLAAAALPAGFFLVLFGPSLAVVLAGEAVFGLTAGLVYFSALYYAMVVRNAAVDAGGAHEGLIGLGFAIGPAAALSGIALAPVLGGRVLGTLVGVGPLILAGVVLSLLALRKARS